MSSPTDIDEDVIALGEEEAAERAEAARLRIAEAWKLIRSQGEHGAVRQLADGRVHIVTGTISVAFGPADLPLLEAAASMLRTIRGAR
jgi:hypothetical protein